MKQKLTDNEFAVVLDSLALTRDRLRDEHGLDTPNIDTALAKLQSLSAPDVDGLTLDNAPLTPKQEGALYQLADTGAEQLDYDINDSYGQYRDEPDAQASAQATLDTYNTIRRNA